MSRLNGQIGRNGQAKRTGQPRKARRTKRAGQARAIAASCPALAGLVVLGLSVTHVAHAIYAITGDWTGSVLLAIGVDCGMVASEAAWVVYADDADTAKWAERVVWGSLAISVGLNVYGFQEGVASWGLWTLAGALGALVPLLVTGLFKVSAGAWKAR
jgi:hypothetical protein